MFGGFCLLFLAILVGDSPSSFGGGGCFFDASLFGVFLLVSGFSDSNSACACWVWGFLFGEFDSGSGRTLAACLTHASRTVRPFGVHEWRTGE